MSGGSGGKIKETSAEKESAAVSYDQWQDFKTRWKPAQNQYIARVRNDYAANKRIAVGAASNDVDAAFAPAVSNANQQLLQRGVGLNSGKGRVTGNNLDVAQARSNGLAKVSATQAADDLHFRQLDGLTAIGRGQQAGATAGLQSLASLSAASARNDAQIAQDNADALGQTIGTAVGAGASLYAMNKPRSMKASTWGTSAGGAGAGGDKW